MGIFIGPAYRLPSTYQEVEYIQSSGTQYIDTGFKGNQNTAFEVKVRMTGTNTENQQRPGGDMGSTLSNSITIAFSTSSSVNNRFGGTVVELPSSATSVGTDYVVSNDKNAYKLNGTTKTRTGTVGTFTTENNMWLLQVKNKNYTEGFIGRMYYAKIWDNGTLIRDYVPCYRKSDSVIGLYDLVNNQFYTNAGSGTFTKGPDVYINQLKDAYLGAYSRVPSSNTLAYRPLTSSTTVNDQSGNGKNFTNTNVTFGTYKGVDCAYFSGDNSCQLRNTSFPNWTDRNWTVACWSYYISNGRTANGNYDQLLWWWGQQGVRRDCYNSPYNKLMQSWCSGYTLTSDSKRLHTVSTFNSTTKLIQFYVNGSLFSSSTYSSGSTSYQNMFTMSNSNDTNNATYKRWKGGASELIVETNKIWDASEVTFYYNSTKSKYGIS